jgi:hypothetical protein
MQQIINKLAAAALALVAKVKGSGQEEVLANMVLRQDLGQEEYNRLADLLFS